MAIAKLAWLVLLTLYASGLTCIALINPILLYLVPRFGKSVRIRIDGAFSYLLVYSLFFHVSTALFMYNRFSPNVAIVIMSLAGFTWALVFYFSERFADPMNRVPFAKTASTMSLAGFIFSVLALMLSANWFWAILPVLIWLVIGFISAEIAIQHRMILFRKRSVAGNKARATAITAINMDQGRNIYAHGGMAASVYPFP